MSIVTVLSRASSSGHHSEETGYIVGDCVLVALATLVVGLRFIVRSRCKMGLGKDDYTILAALGFLIPQAALNISTIYIGAGQKYEDLGITNSNHLLREQLAWGCLYCATVGITKISVLLMYVRIFDSRKLRIWARILGGISIAWALSIVLLQIFECTPIEKSWNVTAEGTCLNVKNALIASSVPNIVIDIAILSLPVSFVWRLQASLSERISVIAIFMLGSFVVYTSAYRLYTLADITNYGSSIVRSEFWDVIESASGVISACLPTLRPLLMFRKLSSCFDRAPPTPHARTTHLRDSYHQQAAFRPQHEWVGKHDVQLEVREHRMSTDQIPLNTICVQQETVWQETVNDSPLPSPQFAQSR